MEADRPPKPCSNERARAHMNHKPLQMAIRRGGRVEMAEGRVVQGKADLATGKGRGSTEHPRVIPSSLPPLLSSRTSNLPLPSSLLPYVNTTLRSLPTTAHFSILPLTNHFCFLSFKSFSSSCFGDNCNLFLFLKCETNGSTR